jgi:hypothetical protein
MRLRMNPVSRISRLILVILMVFVWCRVPQGLAKDAAATGNSATAKVTPTEMADALEKRVKLYAAVDRDMPRDTFDPEFVVRQVGKDPEALFAWVRDNTAYIPYRGALRGAVGVLMDRGGNSLDRSLLLARLLQLAGHQVRLARGQIDPQQGDLILKRVWDDAKSAPPAAAVPVQLDEAAITRLATTYGLDPVQMRQGNEQRQLAMQSKNEDIIGVTTEQSDALAAMIGNVGPVAGDRRADQLAALANHWWVQFSRDSKWLDLDPLTRDAKPGHSVVASGSTVEVPADGQLPPIAAMERQDVELRIQIERSDKGAAKIESVFKYTISPAELAGLPIKLEIAPMDWPSELDLTTGDPSAKLKAVLVAQKHWVPMLQIAGQTIIQSAFDDHGIIDAKPRLDPLAKTGKSVAAGINIASDILGDRAGTEPTSELTAAWLDFEIRVPGRKPRIVRRDLFDAVGPAARAAHAAADVKINDALRLKRASSFYREMNLLTVGFVPSAAYVQHLAMANLVSNGPTLVKALRESSGKPQKESLKDVSTIKRLPTAILGLAAARMAPVGAGAALAVDCPNIFALYEGFGVDAAGTVLARAEIDIVANEVAIRGANAANAFKSRLTQGILETGMERYAIGSTKDGVNTVTLFAASEGQKVGWVKLTSIDDPQFSRVRLSGDTLARIRGDLAAGYVVAAPATPITTDGQPREGWWRIDPRDGSCIGFAADGAGASMAEYALVMGSVLLEAIMAYKCIKGGGYALGCVVCGAAAAMADILSLGFGAELGAAAAISGAEFGFARACEHLIAE